MQGGDIYTAESTFGRVHGYRSCFQAIMQQIEDRIVHIAGEAKTEEEKTLLAGVYEDIMQITGCPGSNHESKNE